MTLSTQDSSNSNQTLSEADNLISEKLVTARKQAQALTDYPGDTPLTLAQAYAIQSASISRWPDEVAGWKVGMIPPALRDSLKAERLIGPIFKRSIEKIQSGGKTTRGIFHGGFAAVEAEFLIEIGKDIEPQSKDYTDDELVALVSAMYIGAEIASSPLPTINKLGPCVTASDFGNNAGLIVGPEIPDWSSQVPESLISQVSVDGELVGDASAAGVPGGPLQALRFIVKLFAERNMMLAKGTLISTGASTGIHEVTVDSKSTVTFPPHGSFDVDFKQMEVLP